MYIIHPIPHTFVYEIQLAFLVSILLLGNGVFLSFLEIVCSETEDRKVLIEKEKPGNRCGYRILVFGGEGGIRTLEKRAKSALLQWTQMSLAKLVSIFYYFLSL